jgi:hypothetical protein
VSIAQNQIYLISIDMLPELTECATQQTLFENIGKKKTGPGVSYLQFTDSQILITIKFQKNINYHKNYSKT